MRLGAVLRILSAFVAALGTPLVAVAQSNSRPADSLTQQHRAFESGARVRITEGGLGRSGAIYTGTVVAASPEAVSLKLSRNGEMVSINRAKMTLVELSAGRNKHVGAGLGYGFLVGAGFGAIMGAVKCGDGGSCEMGRGSAAGVVGVLGGVVGLVVGGVIGAVGTEHWETVQPSRLSVTAGPTRSGFTVALSAHF